MWSHEQRQTEFTLDNSQHSGLFDNNNESSGHHTTMDISPGPRLVYNFHCEIFSGFFVRKKEEYFI